MNKEKIISFLMMLILEKTHKALQILGESENEFDDNPVRVCIKDIDYYARMIIERDGAK